MEEFKYADLCTDFKKWKRYFVSRLPRAVFTYRYIISLERNYKLNSSQKKAEALFVWKMPKYLFVLVVINNCPRIAWPNCGILLPLLLTSLFID